MKSSFVRLSRAGAGLAGAFIVTATVLAQTAGTNPTSSSAAANSAPTGQAVTAPPKESLPPLPPPVTTLGQPKNLPLLPAPKGLPPGTKPTPEVLQRIRDAKPSAEALAKQNAAHPLIPRRPAISTKKASLGLPRVDGPVKAGGPSRISPQKFEVDPLAVPPGADGMRQGQQRHVTFLELNPGTEWSRNLRGNPHDVVFVSLNLHASVTTVIQAGDAWLSILPSEKPGRVALFHGTADGKGGVGWKRAGVESPLETFGGKDLGALPILTLRLDPASESWDLFSGGRLVAAALPMIPDAKGKFGHRKLVVRAGAAGAWLNAVAVADESPLFADENNNGIDDAYEVGKRGSLLAANAPASERKALAREWSQHQRRNTPATVLATRPLPDRLAAEKQNKR